jgi:CubicO group peptidase (beta-lactamase class C family)
MRCGALASTLALSIGLAAHGEPAPLPEQPAGVAWPTAGWPAAPLPVNADRRAIEASEAALFAPSGRGGLPDTRALLVVQGGRVVLEHYADGFGPASRFRSWSMAKSVTNALVGILVREGKLSLDAEAPVPRWARDGDARGALTLRQLLNMTSGLDNADGGDDADSFVARLFFGDLSADSADGAAKVDLAYEPGTHWAYSTATSQILSGVVARSVGGGREGVRAFAERELAEPLGITSLVLEFDRAETPLGGGYVWASAPDWARLGLLYLRGGVWDGRRILPAGWVDFTRTPAPAENNRTFGAHFWITAPPGPEQFQTLRPGIEAFQMNGNAGQFVVMVPDRDLIVVRLGEMHVVRWPELNERLGDLVLAFPPNQRATP